VSWTWISSAAIVGLIVSTVIYGWQRSLEYKFHLQKEKRELFGKVLRRSRLLFRDLIDGKMDDISFVWGENWVEAEGLLELLKLYEAPGVYAAFRALMNRLKEKGSEGVKPGLSPREQIADILELEDALAEEMRLELTDTVRSFKFLKRKRFRFAATNDLLSMVTNSRSKNATAQRENK